MASQNNPLVDTQAEMTLKSQVTSGGNSTAGVGEQEDHQGPVHFCQV